MELLIGIILTGMVILCFGVGAIAAMFIFALIILESASVLGNVMVPLLEWFGRKIIGTVRILRGKHRD